MTVAQLIEFLKTQDQDKKLVIRTGEEGGFSMYDTVKPSTHTDYGLLVIDTKYLDTTSYIPILD